MSARTRNYAAMRPALHRPPAQLFSPLQLCEMKSIEQVAAVCYRIGNAGIKFLLVRTGGGRWTFPKGNAEPGLTYAESAALEAHEEAGVHGRMEMACFGRYIHRKRSAERSNANRGNLTVHAYLCEVVRLGHAKESDRAPTWFSVERAKQRLQQNRAPDYAAELTRIIGLAVARIRRLSDGTCGNETLQRVCFDAFSYQRSVASPMLVLGAERRDSSDRHAPRRLLEVGIGGTENPAMRSRLPLGSAPRLTNGNCEAGTKTQKAQVTDITEAPQAARIKAKAFHRYKRNDRLR
jgi:8-oxo-dGTP pyrophosphatase MutT (NUDIX family)